MNARNFDHYLGFWNGFLGFAATRPKTPSSRKASKAKGLLRRLSVRRGPTR